MTFSAIGSNNIFVQSPNGNTYPFSNEVTSPINKHVTSPIEQADCKPVTCANISGYFPNLTMTVEDKKFDIAFEKATKLSDGSAVLRPTIYGETNTITSNDNGTYTIVTQPTKIGTEPSIKTISEEELINDKNLCTGLLYKNDDGTFDITYEFKDNDIDEWIPVTINNLDKKSVMNIMKSETMHF